MAKPLKPIPWRRRAGPTTARLAHGHEAASAVCESLGLDPNLVYEVRLKINASGEFLVEVDGYAPHTSVPGLCRTFSRYRMVRTELDLLTEQRLVATQSLASPFVDFHRVDV